MWMGVDMAHATGENSTHGVLKVGISAVMGDHMQAHAVPGKLPT